MNFQTLKTAGLAFAMVALPGIGFTAHTYLWEAFSRDTLGPSNSAKFEATKQCLRVTHEAETRLAELVRLNSELPVDHFSVTGNLTIKKQKTLPNTLGLKARINYSCHLKFTTTQPGYEFVTTASPWTPDFSRCDQVMIDQTYEKPWTLAQDMELRSFLLQGEKCRVRSIGLRSN
jgi:hypothetical protein